MNNKKVIGELYNKKFNKKENLKQIHAQIENKTRINYKYALTPTFIVLIILTSFILDEPQKIKLTDSTYINEILTITDKKNNNCNENSNTNCVQTSNNEKISLYINSIQDKGLTRIDATYKSINESELKEYNEISNLNIPKTLTEKEIHAIYVRTNRETKNYDKLNNFEISFTDKENNKNIIISFSNENKPPRDYHFGETNTSNIKGTTLIIGKYEDSYLTTFTYNNINFDIETRNISLEEFTNLLTSIITK